MTFSQFEKKSPYKIEDNHLKFDEIYKIDDKLSDSS
jgi:hypothetical protein